jgi:desulfoferrodoxin-like iron-binding protein
MVVEKVGQKHSWNICGNEVVIPTAGGRTLVCCGEDPRLYTRRLLVGEWPASPGR